MVIKTERIVKFYNWDNWLIIEVKIGGLCKGIFPFDVINTKIYVNKLHTLYLHVYGTPFFVQLPILHPKSLRTSFYNSHSYITLQKWLPDAGLASPNISLLWTERRPAVSSYYKQRQLKRIIARSCYSAILARMELLNSDTAPELTGGYLLESAGKPRTGERGQLKAGSRAGRGSGRRGSGAGYGSSYL